MRNKHVQAAAEGLPKEDPALVIAKQIIASRHFEENLSERILGVDKSDGISKAHFEARQMTQYDHTDALKQMLSVVKATTHQGAANQICEALSRVDLIRDAMSDMAYENKLDFRALDRLLWSALAVLDPGGVALLRGGLAVDPLEDDHDKVVAESRRFRAELEATTAARKAKKGGAA